MMKKSCVWVLIFCLAVLPATGWSSSIDTLSGWTGASVGSFGDMANGGITATTFGQTFKITGGNARLGSVTFKVSDNAPLTAPQVSTFQTVLMQWNGTRPVGDPLFASGPLVTSGGFGTWDTFNVSLDDTEVAEDQEYVLFFTADNFLDHVRSDAAMASVGDIYGNGGFVSHAGENGWNDLFASDWNTGAMGTTDLALRIEYQIIPEPASLMLLAFGGLALRMRRG
jgi:hypothetical protein